MIKEKLFKEAMEKKEELDPECTFQPKLNSNYNLNYVNYTGPIEERTVSWKLKREKHLDFLRDISEKKKYKECTFQPELVIIN